MKYELTKEQLLEIADCIAINNLSADEACNYIIAVALEMQDVEEVAA